VTKHPGHCDIDPNGLVPRFLLVLKALVQFRVTVSDLETDSQLLFVAVKARIFPRYCNTTCRWNHHNNLRN